MSDPAECPRDGREWEPQCSRCGTTADGLPHSYRDGDAIRIKWGYACWAAPEHCQANPLPGREGVERGRIEWVLTETKDETK